MAIAAFTGKEKFGRINIERYKDSIRLRWQLDGKRYSLTIGKDSKDTIKAARAKAGEIDADITFERFDHTLASYGKKYSSSTLEVVSNSSDTTLTLQQLWQQFLEDKLNSNLKPKTKAEYEYLNKLIERLDKKLSFDPIEVKKALLSKNNSQDVTARVLIALSSCCNWGIKNNRISNNPFSNVIDGLSCGKRKAGKQANAFTPDEIEKIIKAFQKSYDYGCYAPLVIFLFKTGCRPSEAIGLQWRHVSEDCSKIMFRGSVQTINGATIWSPGSKNNRTRDLNISLGLSQMLRSLRDEAPDDDEPVFPSPTGKFINYNNFSRRAWKTIVDPIKPETTPYNCRDSFISEQLLKGVPSAVISKWCDTSARIIETTYADQLRLSTMRPID